jgi:hypothetical protein
MIELLRTNDAVLISAVEALLAAAGVASLRLDEHTSALEGSIGALPRRLMVSCDDAAAARALLVEAGYGHELRPAGP